MGCNILITGACGFLGSALCADLSTRHRVIGLYQRPPGQKLKAAASGVTWMRGDVSRAGCVDRVFREAAGRGRPIDYVIHFAAFTGFGKKWEAAYDRINVAGTRNIIESAAGASVKRLLFAGSIAALEPPDPGQVLTEASPPGGRVAYARSKAMGERLCYENAGRVPAVVLRLGGVFTDWCELPPLFSLIKLWRRPFMGRMMPGRGLAGFPYIHRRDVVGMVREIIEKDGDLGRYEVLFASPSGATSQRELFPVIRKAYRSGFSTAPIHVHPGLAKFMLHGKYLANRLRLQNTYERAWMLDYADRPLVVDTAYTRKRLGWRPDPGLHILRRIPVLMAHVKADSRAWMIRNINRNEQKYLFDPDSP
ncbi:MAG: NAD(P)-dependent oxidoreductase [Desulfobacter sp.]|nr:MAG: NAD(P)-dependent oxidoreductase [Desulfobacter sp.]